MKPQRAPRTPVASPTPGERSPEVLERIRTRAHEIFEQRGRQDGHDLDDWLRAETEVTGRKVKTTAA